MNGIIGAFLRYLAGEKLPPAEHMIRTQIEERGVRDARVLAAMRAVDRSRFLPDDLRPRAWEDRPLPIGEGQTISQPYIVAAMTEALDLAPEHHVLEIGTGSGYQTAILALLARDVLTIERHAALSHRAQEALRELGFTNVQFRIGDGARAADIPGTFDRILVTAAAARVRDELLERLAPGGVLIAPEETGRRAPDLLAVQSLRRWRRGADGALSEPEHLMDVRFVPLVEDSHDAAG